MIRNKFSVKSAVLLALLLAAALLIALLPGCNKAAAPALFTDEITGVEAKSDTHVRVTVAGDPQIVYAPLQAGAGYRYGPSIMYYADGTSDAWFSCLGSFGEWDWVTVKHSEDCITYSNERSVLAPTPDSYDKFSCCDPGAVYFNGYYYVGYTSTIDSHGGGVNNNVFIARSKTASGPYEKWNGSGWGGEPAPVIYYDELDTKYGAGEPSMVVKDGVLYMYYSWICSEGNYTKVSTSDLEEDWPARLTDRGFAYQKVSSQDSLDVAYLEDAGKFIAFATQQRFSENSGIAVLESEDGITFYQTDFICEGLYQYCHNMGISRRPDGHIQLKDNLFVGYAFSDGGSENWGKWATAFQPVKLELYTGEVSYSPASKSTLCTDYFTDPELERPMIAFSLTDRILELYTDDDKQSFNPVWADSFLGLHQIEDTGKIKYSNYDTSLIKIKGTMVYSKGKAGVTSVTATYKGWTTEFKVLVHTNFNEFQESTSRTVTEFTPVCDEFVLKLSDAHHRQIRGLVRFSNSTWAEAFNDGEMVNYDLFPVTYEVADTAVAEVSDRGIIYPVGVGTTTVKVTIAGEKSFTVTITVTE